MLKQARKIHLTLLLTIAVSLSSAPAQAQTRLDIEHASFAQKSCFAQQQSQVLRIKREGQNIQIVVAPKFFAETARDEIDEQDRIDAVLGWLESQGTFSRVDFLIEENGLLRQPPRRQWPSIKPAPRPRHGVNAWWVTPPDARFPYGAPLANKTVALSAGHGWYYRDGAWKTQRGRYKFDGCGSCRGIVEDFSNADLVDRWLIPYLEGAGAHVVLVRERSMNSWGQTVDDGDAAYSEQNTWRAGNSAGAWQNSYRVSAAGDNGQATFQITVPRAQSYLVSMYYVEGDNRSTNTFVDVIDAVNTTRYRVDQRSFGRRFMPLGQHSFAPGAPAKVLIQNGSDEGYIIADAIHIGGGMHDESGHVWWQMSAEEYIRHNGASSDVTSRGDVTIRPAFAEYVGADAYLSVHSNATGTTGNATGTTSYRFNCLSYPDHSADPDAADCDDPRGSDLLQDRVHNHLINRLRSDWDDQWCDRGTRVANFGELRELDNIPGTLVETAFHDNLTRSSCSDGTRQPRQSDNKSLHDPDFRRLVGRGLYEGLLDYLAPGAAGVLDPPDRLRALSDDEGHLIVSWNPVNNARGYRVFVAKDGLSFDQGRDSETSSLQLDDIDPLSVVCLRVASLNEGGVGLSSGMLCARPRMARTHVASADILLIDGFDRLDPWVQSIDNHRDATRRHAQALAAISAFDVAADASSDEAVSDGQVDLSPYRAVILAFGLESTADRTFTTELQARIDNYRASGGVVIASGAEIGWEMWRTGNTSDQDWFKQTFAASFAADDAGSNALQSDANGPVASLAAMTFCDAADSLTDPDCYAVLWPDVWSAETNGQALIRYPDQSIAAVYQAGHAPTVMMGFPFETLVGENARRDLMQALLGLCLDNLSAGDLDLDGMPDDWEQRNNLDPANADDADQDSDQDGTSNLQEYQNGTDPWNGHPPQDAGLQNDAANTDARTNTDANATTVDAGLSGSGGDLGQEEEPGCGCGDCSSTGAKQNSYKVMLWAGLLFFWRRRRI